MDDEAGWRLLEAGEVLHIDADLTVERSRPFPSPPRHLLQLGELDPRAASSQHPHAAGGAN